MTERALHRDDVTPGRDEAGGVEVPQVVQPVRRIAEDQALSQLVAAGN